MLLLRWNADCLAVETSARKNSFISMVCCSPNFATVCSTIVIYSTSPFISVWNSLQRSARNGTLLFCFSRISVMDAAAVAHSMGVMYFYDTRQMEECSLIIRIPRLTQKYLPKYDESVTKVFRYFHSALLLVSKRLVRK